MAARLSSRRPVGRRHPSAYERIAKCGSDRRSKPCCERRASSARGDGMFSSAICADIIGTESDYLPVRRKPAKDAPGSVVGHGAEDSLAGRSDARRRHRREIRDLSHPARPRRRRRGDRVHLFDFVELARLSDRILLFRHGSIVDEFSQNFSHAELDRAIAAA